MNPHALTKEDSSTLGFVVSCLFEQAVSIEELQTWAGNVLLAVDPSPLYIVDLCTFEGPLFKIFDVIGFVTSGDLSDEEKTALVGIAHLRGVTPYEAETDRAQALAALAAHPQVLADFRETFPFIELPQNV
ncbi:hypothetical protein [Prosthecobacter sp.]|uniref:hypothetical protein n=1 Tax=Prosthecobacter sp. TaxID=1965333 RepID=UPI003784FC32